MREAMRRLCTCLLHALPLSTQREFHRFILALHSCVHSHLFVVEKLGQFDSTTGCCWTLHTANRKTSHQIIFQVFLRPMLEVLKSLGCLEKMRGCWLWFVHSRHPSSQEDEENCCKCVFNLSQNLSPQKPGLQSETLLKNMLSCSHEFHKTIARYILAWYSDRMFFSFWDSPKHTSACCPIHLCDVLFSVWRIIKPKYQSALQNGEDALHPETPNI